MNEDEQAEEESPETQEERDLFESVKPNMHVITITYHDDGSETPEIDLGDTSPWLALTLLGAAVESTNLMIPPMNVSYRGTRVIHTDDYTSSLDEEDEN